MASGMTEFKANGRTAHGYLALPEQGSGPGIIVIQEWWGLVDNIKDVADRFATAGFAALAPDLYHGSATKSPDEAGKLMMALNIAETEKDLRGAVDHLLAQPSVRGKKVGVVGFCMGGQLSLFAASKNSAIGACVDFYGLHPNVKPDWAGLKAPVLGLFAENDAYVNPAAVGELQKTLESHGVSADVHIYPAVAHGFFNNTRPEVHNAAAAADAWARVLKFFGQHLG